MKSYISTTNSKKKFVCDNPDVCPMCNSTISPIAMYSFENDISKMLARSFECPACGKGFISHYKLKADKENYRGDYYNVTDYIGSYPNHPSVRDFDDNIVNVSSSFCEIYNQALAAESYCLNEISGIAYRKALEFLIKDYCIFKNPDKEEEIKKRPLLQVINDYVDSEKIKNNAKAAAWIGNDETHYFRKYEDKDINSLKNFIEATLAFIMYDVISDEAANFVNGDYVL